MTTAADLARVEITEKDIAAALGRPDSFAYFGDNPEMFETWAIGPTLRTRDSTLLEESNADALLEALAEAEKAGTIEPDSYEVLSSSHWGCGWVEQVSFRAVGPEGKPTNVFRFLKAWSDSLSNYPVADDEDYSRREYEATLENIESEGRGVLDDNPPEDWAEQVHRWLWENDQEALENSDDRGGYPTEDQIRAAAKDLGFAEPDEDEEADERDAPPNPAQTQLDFATPGKGEEPEA